MRVLTRLEKQLNLRSKMKVLAMFGIALMIVSTSGVAHAFTTLTCTGTIDVRLLGPKTKKPKVARAFSITRKDALELELSVNDHPVGHLFPWDHVVWEEAKSLADFKDVKFKTDDQSIITISLYDIGEKKSHELNCRFSF